MKYAGSTRFNPGRVATTAACPASGMSMTTTRGFCVAAAFRPPDGLKPVATRCHAPNCCSANANALSGAAV